MGQIKHEALVSMAQKKIIDIATVIESQDGFHVSVRSQDQDYVLISKRGSPRRFANVESAGKILVNAGVWEFVVRMDKNRLVVERARKRGDVSSRMKRIHQSYDEYVLSEISEARKEKGESMPHDDVMDEIDALIDNIGHGKHAKKS